MNINKNNIKQVTNFEYLGVLLDNKLSWHDHIKNLQTKLAKFTGVFYRIRNFVPRKILIMLYNALVGSYLRYAVRAWGSASPNLCSCLQAAQNKVIRALLFLPPSSDVSQKFSELRIQNVENIFEHEVAKLIHSVYYKYCPSAFSNFFEVASHRYATRLREYSFFSLMKPNTEFGKKSLKFFGVKIWFKLPSVIKEIPKPEIFNREFKKLYFDN